MNIPLHQFKADLFKALAHPARIKILELLRRGERTVSDLQASLELESSSVSQQLGILRARQIIAGRRVSTNVYYRVRDPRIYVILDAAREIFETHVQDLQALLDAQRAEDDALEPERAPADDGPIPASTV